MVAGQLEIMMFANIARLTADMNQMKGVVGGAMKSVESAVSSAKSVLGGLGAGLSVAVLLHKVDSVTEGMAKLQDASEKTGASVEKLSQLQFFAGVSGSNIEAVTTALAKLSKGMVSTGVEAAPTTQALKFLGLSAKDAAGNLKDPSALFEEISQKLIGYEDGAGKAAIAQALFGKAGAEMLPTLKKMAELGAVEATVTKEQAQAAEDYQVALARLHRQKEAVWNQIVGAMLPSMQALVEALLEASKKTDSLQGAAKNLAQDGSIEAWADKGAMAVAILVDAIKVIPQILSAVSSSFKVVGADIDLVGKAATATNPILFGVAKAAGRNPLQELADAVVARNELLAQANDKYAALLNGEVDATQKAVRAQIESRKSLNNFMKGIGVDAMLDDAMFGGGGALKKLNFAPADAKLAAAELKLYQGAVKRLVDELGNLNHQSEQEKLAFELMGKEYTTADGKTVHLTGNLEKLTAAHKAVLPFIAKEIDDRRALILVSKLNGEAYDALYKSQQQLLSIQTSAFQADKDFLEDQQFQIGLIGRTRIEQEKLNEVRKIDLKLRADLKAAADAAGDNMDQYDAARAVLLRQAEDQKVAVLEGVAVRVQAERDWMTGANAAFSEYIDHATNAAEQSKNLFTRAFQSMEDALVEFARTGKLDFKKLADSIIADIIRIQTRAAIANAMGPISSGGGGGFGGIIGLLGQALGFGGGSGIGYGSAGTAAGSAMVADGFGGFVAAIGKGAAFDSSGMLAFANGGVVGAPTRFRFADGGAMRDGIMGEAGPEAILPLKRVNGQLGVASSGGEAGPVVSITQNINVDSRSDIASVRAAMTAAKNEAVREVANQVRRGGNFRKAVRG